MEGKWKFLLVGLIIAVLVVPATAYLYNRSSLELKEAKLELEQAKEKVKLLEKELKQMEEQNQKLEQELQQMREQEKALREEIEALKVELAELRLKLSLDSDSDGFNDWFEKNIAHYDPNIPNDRYIIVLEPWEEEVFGEVNHTWQFFREVAKVPTENIITLRQKDATPLNLKKAIEEVATKADENDILCLHLNAHGNQVGIGGYNDNIYYADINKWLDEVDAKVIIISVIACDFYEYGAPVLKDGHCPRIIAPAPLYYRCGDPTYEIVAEVDEYGNKDGYVLVAAIVDGYGNKDGYVSMEEVKYYINYICYKDFPPEVRDYHEWVIDTSNVAPEIYLTDLHQKS